MRSALARSEGASGFTRVEQPMPHPERARRLLAAHPEVRSLFGPNPWTAVLAAAVVALQLGVAAWMGTAPWWAAVLGAVLVGAFVEHALFAVIHECTHNLVFRSARANRWMALFANLPGVFPSAMAFRAYHLLHHRFMGEPAWDADVPGPVEARRVGNRWWGKLLWLSGFAVIEGAVRPARLRKVRLTDGWGLLNLAVTTAAAAAAVALWGWNALLYLTLSTLFSVGLHPVGGRWIQEHFVMRPGQETYSYYGPLNRLSFNVGYHNEHHDLPRVAWNRLPRLKAMAPEFYEPLYAHHSWSGLVLRFLFDPTLSLYDRVIRRDHDAAPEDAPAPAAARAAPRSAPAAVAGP